MPPKRKAPATSGLPRASRGAEPVPESSWKNTDGLLTSRQFFQMLRRRTPRTAQRVDREIERLGQRELTVMVTDSSGFSRRSHDHGILQFLSVMTRCHEALVPLIDECDGICLSHGADNLLAIFDRPAAAIEAAMRMHRYLQAFNARQSHESETFHVCLGLHHGPLIRLKDNVYGDTVNVACKVGEDLASSDEILVTGAVRELAPDFPYEYARSAPIGGRTFELYRVPW